VNVLRADKDSNNIHVYDGRGSSDILYTFDKLHNSPVVMMKVMHSKLNSFESFEHLCMSYCVIKIFLTLIDSELLIIHVITNILICYGQFTTRYWTCGRI